MIENNFVVVVPVYNADKYIEKCLKSILDQTYKNYELIVINDGSTDKTKSIIEKIRKECGYKINIHNIDKNYGSQLYSFKLGIEFIFNKKEDIIVTVDGDDYLTDNTVLDYLNFVYQDPNVWMTYGQFSPLSDTYSDFCKPIEDFRKYRKSGIWYTSHLRTFKKKLWDKINPNDLKDTDGKYYKAAGDAAFMFPCLEMCGPKHTKFIDKVLYIYNDLNPLCDMKIHKENQLRIAKRIQNMPLYEELDADSL
jgi:glycosyltransferase involved in cell wall biosynthesis